MKRSNEITGFVLLIALLSLAGAAKVVRYDTLDPDCFWHLRVGDALSRQGWPGPMVDHLSYASMKEPWTPYSWLGELGMRWLWNAGGYRAAVGAQALMEAGFIALVALAAVEATRGEGGKARLMAAGLGTLMAAILSLAYLSFRPVTMALVGLAAIAWLLLRDRRMGQRSKGVWIVPVLCAILINVHFFMVMVLLWTGALVVGDAIERRGRVGRGVVLLGLCAGACLMTPMLPGMVRAMVHYGSRDVMVHSNKIAEMGPFYGGTMGRVSAALVVLLGVCVAWRCVKFSGRPRLGELLWLAGSGVLLFTTGRMAPVFAIIAGPMLAATLPEISDRVLGRRIVIGAIGVILLGGIWRVGMEFPRRGVALSTWVNRWSPAYPCAAADFVQGNMKPVTGRLICEFTWGGYLEWRLGDRYQVLMDGRTQVFSAEFWRKAVFGTEEDRRRLLEEQPADVAVLPRERSLFLGCLKSMGWKVIYQDENAVVMVPGM